MSKQKVTLRIEEGEVELLKEKYSTDNQSEAIRLAIMGSLATEDSKKVKTLFPYIGKKPPRIGREVTQWGQALKNWNKFYKKCLNIL